MIYTFYSYKGGVGRSMALANVVEIFAQSGLKVLMIDWDLEAPGLERFFPTSVEDEITDQPGLMDLLTDYKDIISRAPQSGKQETIESVNLDNYPFPNISPYCIELNKIAKRYNNIFLITAGRRKGNNFQGYANNVLTFDWQDFYQNWEGELFFEWLKEEFFKIADVVFIDSRTGVTEMGGVCTFHLADTIVMFCSGTSQSLNGTFEMANNFKNPKLIEDRNNRPLEVIVVPARVDNKASTQVDIFQEEFLQLFSNLVPKSLGHDSRILWNLNIPYVPKYSFKERVAIHEKDKESAKDLVEAYVNLSKALVNMAPDDSKIASVRRNVYGFLDILLPELHQEPSLDEALTQLAQLPLDSVPDPGLLPSNSRIPHSPNPLFTGREEALKTLAQTLKGEDQHGQQVGIINQPAAITGLGGIGKTQLAAEFAHRYGQYFPGGVYWVNFANPSAVPIEIAASGREMNLPGFENLTLPEQTQRVLQEWQKPIPSLLVFDNLEEEDLLTQYRPKSGGARVLVTSRRGRWSPSLALTTIPLDLPTRAQSIELLQRFWPPLTFDEADTIAETLGDLPLALNLAGSYLAYFEGAVSPTQFLAELNKTSLFHEALTGEFEGPSPTSHDRNVARTFELSYKQLGKGDGLAKRILVNLTQLAPGETVPFELILATLGKEGKRPSKKEIIIARQRLTNLGLIMAEPESALRLHRLLHSFVRRVVGKKLLTRSLHDVEKGVLSEAQRLNDAGYPAPLLVWQNHLRYVTDVTLLRKDKWAANLSINLANHLRLVADYTRAKYYMGQALVIRKTLLGSTHPDTASSLNYMGELLYDMGDLNEARSYFEQALAINEKVQGATHPDTALNLNNLGFLLDTMGDQSGAKHYFERALTIRKKTLGTGHPDTATSLNNLGYVLDGMGDYEGARLYFEQALAIDEQALGPNHPKTAIDLNNLGALLRTLGDLAGAQPYFERALAIYEETLGPEHPDTAATLNNLGSILQGMGDLNKARPYFERALTINEKALNPDHPDMAYSLNNLGMLLKAMGDFDEAKSHLKRALIILKAKLGSNHPNTQHVRKNLEELWANEH